MQWAGSSWSAHDQICNEQLQKKFKLNYKLKFSPAYSRDETNVTYINLCILSNEFQMSETLIC